MAFDDNGVLHVANMNADQIVALPDRNHDGVADEHIVAARGFKEAHSLAFYQGVMYVADTDAIIKFRDADADLVYEDREMLTELTSPGACCANGWHTTRTRRHRRALRSVSPVGADQGGWYRSPASE